ncbi:MAG TPA: PAS domain-containing protein [Dissulfurispiraceae bacterium]|nr:PAS domain-containing protein [Dissulfurispiraceae bacterium]
MSYARNVRGSLRMRMVLIFGLGSVVFFLAIRIVSFTGIPWLNFEGERDTFIHSAKQSLHSVADREEAAVQQWFQERLGNGRLAVAYPTFRKNAVSLSRIVQRLSGEPLSRVQRLLAEDGRYHHILGRLHLIERTFNHYDRIDMVDLVSGIRSVSSDETVAGTIAPYAKELQGGRTDEWGEKIFFSSEGSRAYMYLAFAINMEGEQSVAALVYRIDPATFLLQLFHESALLGVSGEIIMIDMQRKLLTPLKYNLPDGSAAQPLSYTLETKQAEIASLGIEALFSSVDYRGVPVIAAVRHVRVMPDFWLGLIVKRDEHEIYEPLRQSLFITGAVTGFGLVLLLALVAYVSGAITRSLESLSATARKIASGDLRARSPIAGKDEIAVLAGTFNKMADRIQQTHENLEMLVAARTEELAAANQLLRVEMQERLKTEDEIRRSEERFRLAMDAASDGLWDWDVSAGTVYYSPGYFRMLGYEPEGFDGIVDTWLKLLHPDDRAAAVEVIESCLQNKTEGFKVEFRMLAKDGTWRWILGRGRAVTRDADERATKMIGTHTDITERKHIENQLVQAQKMEAVGRLAGGVAHDFNNMLAIIFIALELIRMRLPMDNPAHEHLDSIEKAATRSRDIARQLLAFSRKQLILPRPCDLNVIIHELEKSLARLIGEDIEIRFFPGQELGSILIDPAQADQVLVNLAVNARDAMPHGGKLTIATANIIIDEAYCEKHPEARPGRHVRLSVSDEGVGMDKQTLAHIFEPFFTTKEVGKGTGLGLAMIYGIVKQNDGFVNVYSEVGSGTSFNLYFPRIDSAVHLPETPETLDVETGRGRILLVEDDESLCRVTKSIIEILGYTVETASSPAEALGLFEHECPDFALLLTDVVMPGMSGRDLAERIGEKCPGIKVIFMSGYTSSAIMHRGVLEKDMNFIQKPFSVKELAAKIGEVMRA